MSDAEEVKFSLKVMVNKERTKVLFAESDSHFVDILLCFLTLPLARIVKVMKKHYGDEAPIIGCVSTLYNSLSNLESSHFWTEGAKQILLNPWSSFDKVNRKLKLDITDSQRERFSCAKCLNKFWSKRIYYDKSSCKICGGTMKRVVAKKKSLAHRSGGVFALDMATFVITDDLQIVPSANCAKGLLKTITGTENAELMNVTLGLNEVIGLLRASMISKTPLSDIILKRARKLKVKTSLTQCNLAPVGNPKSKKMILKVTVQKSTNRFLFAEAKEDFVEFLFSLLTIPLGGVECLLASNTSIKSIVNLYRSARDLIDDEYFKSSKIKKKLIKPKLPHGYIAKNHILPLTEKSLRANYEKLSLFSSENFPQGQGKYINGSRIYQVMDDLSVTPYRFSSILCSLNQQMIPVSDLKELEMEIGLKEIQLLVQALRILKASLTFNSALTDALLNRMSSKQANKKPDSSNSFFCFCGFGNLAKILK